MGRKGREGRDPGLARRKKASCRSLDPFGKKLVGEKWPRNMEICVFDIGRMTGTGRRKHAQTVEGIVNSEAGSFVSFRVQSEESHWPTSIGCSSRQNITDALSSQITDHAIRLPRPRRSRPPFVAARRGPEPA